MKRKCILFLLFVLFFSACIRNIDFPIPGKTALPVLNAVLNPDSLIKVQLSKMKPLSDTSRTYEWIENAQVEIYENEIWVGKAEYTQKGTYILAYQPKAGFVYSVKASIDGYATLEASDKMPLKPHISIEGVGQGYYGNSLLIYSKIIDNPETSENYWLNALIQDYRRTVYSCVQGETRLETIKIGSYDSNAPFIDKFNGYFNNRSGSYAYGGGMRFEDQSFAGKEQTLDFEVLVSFCTSRIPKDFNQQIFAYLINAGPAYDRYEKTSLKDRMSRGDVTEFNPFYEPVLIYSNIKNGTGIFACYNAVKVWVPKAP